MDSSDEDNPQRSEFRTLQQRVFDRLRRRIMLGQIAPGQSLTIRGLAQDLKVSATPVREALRRLVSERAVELLDNRRVRIPPMTLDRFEELIAARIILEGEAAERALPYITDDHIARLEALDLRVTSAQNARDYDAWIELNFTFHSTLYGLAPQSTFLPLIETLWLQTGPFLRRAMIASDFKYTVDRHVEALVALRERNRLALRIAIEADIRDGISHIGNQLIRIEARRASDAQRAPRNGPPLRSA